MPLERCVKPGFKGAHHIHTLTLYILNLVFGRHLHGYYDYILLHIMFARNVPVAVSNDARFDSDGKNCAVGRFFLIAYLKINHCACDHSTTTCYARYDKLHFDGRCTPSRRLIIINTFNVSRFCVCVCCLRHNINSKWTSSRVGQSIHI